jgi:hypothetical protein
MNTVINYKIPKEVESFLPIWVNTGFTRRNLRCVCSFPIFLLVKAEASDRIFEEIGESVGTERKI